MMSAMVLICNRCEEVVYRVMRVVRRGRGYRICGRRCWFRASWILNDTLGAVGTVELLRAFGEDKFGDTFSHVT